MSDRRSEKGMSMTIGDIKAIVRNFDRMMKLDLPPEVAEAMLRIKKYKSGETADEVFGQAGREGYHDDCKIVAECFVSRILAD